jgi:hypothetical protein
VVLVSISYFLMGTSLTMTVLGSHHIVECHGTGADMTFDLTIQKFETILTALEMAPLIITSIIMRLWQWRKHGDHTLPRFLSQDRWGTHKVVVPAQDSIGWYQLLLRGLATKWSDAQLQFLGSLQKHNIVCQRTVLA